MFSKIPLEETDFSNKKYSLNITNPDDLFDDFEEYCSSRLSFKLSVAGFKLAYLLEIKLINTNEMDTFFLRLLDLIESFINECEDFNTLISTPARPREWPFSKFSLLAVATNAVTIRLKNLSDEKNQYRLIKLVETIHLRGPLVPRTLYLGIPRTLLNLAIEREEVEIIRTLMPFIDEKTIYKIFKQAISVANVPIVNIVIGFEYKINKFKHRNYLEQLGAWPLLDIKYSPEKGKTDRDEFPTKTKVLRPEINELVREISNNFPIDNDSSIFNLFFPFSNERGYRKVLRKLEILDNLKKAHAIEHTETDKIKVAVLFGESHFLSMLPQLSKFVDLILLADVEPRQHQHMIHMLECLEQSEAPEKYIRAYLDNNPIMDTSVGEEKLKTNADINFLTRNIKQGGSTGRYNCTSTVERFMECKEAAKRMKIVPIKLDLMDADKCHQLAEIIDRLGAQIQFCNFTNIHHYDEGLDRLNLSISQLLPDAQNCLIMYATGSIDWLETNISQGLELYFSSCLNKTYMQTVTSGKTASQYSSTILTQNSLLGAGLFSSTQKMLESDSGKGKVDNSRPFGLY